MTKHVLFGGDGFVGRHLARDLLALGEEVVICDIHQSDLPIYSRARFVHTDIMDAASVRSAPVDTSDIVYNLAARMLHPIVPRRRRTDYFLSVDFIGAKNVVEHMDTRGCTSLVQFSTDMVYGTPQTTGDIREDHARNPLGAYGESKLLCEDFCMGRRSAGLNVSIFRPRMIVGPGRLGILQNLFRMIERGLPVPLIGNGSNRYQMVSVFDCAAAALASARLGVVNGEFNLGSRNPPPVRQLLRHLIEEAGSRSFLVSTPAGLVKQVLRWLDVMGAPLLDPEQFEIADIDFVVSIENAGRKLDWSPQHDDVSMMLAAYREYKAISKSRIAKRQLA